MRALLALIALIALPWHVPAGADALTRSSEERSVRVEVTPINLAAGAEALDFRVVLDTHVVELDYDLAKLATLRDSRGNTVRPAGWQTSSGGHHVAGTLRFAQTAKLTQPPPAFLELQIEGVAGITRSFRWDGKVFK